MKNHMIRKSAKMDERKLTDGEKDKLKSLEKDVSKKDFIDRYGKEEGEAIYYATDLKEKWQTKNTQKRYTKCQ